MNGSGSKFFLNKENENLIYNTNQEDVQYKDLLYEDEEEQFFVPEKDKIKFKELNINKDRIIFVSLFLPFRAIKNLKNEWELSITNDPFYRTITKVINTYPNYILIGMLKNISEIEQENLESVISLFNKKYNLHIIRLPPLSLERLKVFVIDILDPLFHHITLFNYFELIKDFDIYWKSYCEFNELLAKVILSLIKDNQNSLVFLNDIHVLLTSSYIYNSHHNFANKCFNNIYIGLYIHAPFPSHDVFRRFPNREELLKSMVNCSVIGFHTFDSSRNFLTSCKRLLLLNYESNIYGDLALSYFGRNSIITVKHISSEQLMIKNEIASDNFISTIKEIKEKYKNKYIFVSIDNFMFLPGIKHKIEGYKRFLRDIGDNSTQNVLLQYLYHDESLISEEFQEEINLMKQDISKLASKVKNEFGEDSISVIEKKLSYSERLAVLASGNCFVKTCKNEAFSLDIYEFLNLKIQLQDYNELNYILSTLSGVTSSLSGAIKVNPFDLISIKKGFMEAFQVHFDKETLNSSQEKDLQHVMKNSASKWISAFLTKLKNSNDHVK